MSSRLWARAVKVYQPDIIGVAAGVDATATAAGNHGGRAFAPLGRQGAVDIATAVAISWLI